MLLCILNLFKKTLEIMTADAREVELSSIIPQLEEKLEALRSFPKVIITLIIDILSSIWIDEHRQATNPEMCL